MSQGVPVSKNEDHQTPVPSDWRGTLADVVEAFKEGDFGLKRSVAGVRPISAKDAARMADNVRCYGARLTSLPEEAWQSSVCQWMLEYWAVMVDLFTVEEGASDLALHARVYEEGSTYAFEIHSVHVP